MTGVRIEGIRLRLAWVSALVASLPVLVFAPVLRELEPAALPLGFSLGRLCAHAVLAGGLATALAWVLTAPVAAAFADSKAPTAAGLDAAHRLPVRFTACSFAVWMLLALIGLTLEPARSDAAIGLAGRLGAFAAIGLIGAAANALLATAILAPASQALAQRTTADAQRRVAAPLSFVWRLRLLVFALVASPAWLGGLLARLRDPSEANGLLFAGADVAWLPLAMLALGLGMVEAVTSTLRRDAASLHDDVQRSLHGEVVTPHAPAELAEAHRAVVGVARAMYEARQAVGTVVEALEGRLRELDATRDAMTELSEAQRTDLEGFGESMGQVHADSQALEGAIVEQRALADDSSNAVTRLGSASDQLVGTAAELSKSAERAATSIRGALVSLGEIAVATDVLAGVASEASSSMEEMAASMSDVNENAERCSGLSDQVVSVAVEGSRVVQRTIDGIHAIREATSTVEQVVHGLGERAGEIGAIVDVIDGIANETNLLALNAAIIAAQAGEHGRSFSVVAREIRELATRVTSSTAEITSLIRSVQDESTNAIGAIERGSKSVATGVALSAQAGESLIEITRVARSNKQLVEGIVHSVSEQTRAASHVVGVIEEVSAQAERIRHAAREHEQGNDSVLEHARTMHEIAQHVHQTADEQRRGTRSIAQTIEIFTAGLDRIGSSVKEQTAACAKLVAATGEAQRRAKETGEAAHGLGALGERLRAVSTSARRIITGRRP